MTDEIILLLITAVQIVFGLGLFFVIMDEKSRFRKHLVTAMTFFVLLDCIALYLIIGYLLV